MWIYNIYMYIYNIIWVLQPCLPLFITLFAALEPSNLLTAALSSLLSNPSPTPEILLAKRLWNPFTPLHLYPFHQGPFLSGWRVLQNLLTGPPTPVQASRARPECSFRFCSFCPHCAMPVCFPHVLCLLSNYADFRATQTPHAPSLHTCSSLGQSILT